MILVLTMENNISTTQNNMLIHLLKSTCDVLSDVLWENALKMNTEAGRHPNNKTIK